MMTMKDWDKERISQYFDTADLWNLVNDSTQTEEAKPQIQNIILPETKLRPIAARVSCASVCG
jgi:hypothetical protein